MEELYVEDLFWNDGFCEGCYWALTIYGLFMETYAPEEKEFYGEWLGQLT
jgi:hypothetical protein